MKFNLYPNRNRKAVTYIAIIVIVLEVISLIRLYSLDDLTVSSTVVKIIIILAMLLLIPEFRKIIFGEDPYILIDDEKVIYKTELSRKKQSIDIQNISEIKFHNNCYKFIGKNDKVVKIPIGKISYNDVQNFKSEVDRIIKNNNLE